MKQLIGIWSILLLSGVISIANAQYLSYDCLSEESDLIEGNYSTLLQSFDGSLWVGASAGCWVYDGENTLPVDLKEVINTSDVSAIFEDKTGRKWIGFSTGQIAHEDEFGQFSPWEIEEGWPQAKITAIQEDSLGQLWIATYGEGVYCYSKGRLYQFGKGTGQKITVIKATTDNEEGKRIVDTILEQKTRNHLTNKEIAILYRTNSQSRVFEEYLRRYNIAYRVFGGQSFYQRKEVKDLIGYLRAVVNPKDEEALRRVINFPKRAIGKTTVDKIMDLANHQNISLWDAIKQFPATGRTRSNLNEFIDIIESARKKLDKVDAFEVATMISKRSKLEDFYKKDNSIEGMSRQENYQSLLNGIQAFVAEEKTAGETEDTQDKGLASYLQNIALLTDADDKDPENADNVTLMSVHAAKGLEFRSVFVSGLEEKLFPSFMSMDTPEGLDEERRLFYVAITRAEEFLTLSFANARYRFGKMSYNEPSRFLTEIPAHHVTNTANLSSVSNDARTPMGPPAARVTGHFKRNQAGPLKPVIDPKDFKPSPNDQIRAGMIVLHLKFGKGKVVHIDNGIAQIHFKGISNPEKKIMLKFAKLQILE